MLWNPLSKIDCISSICQSVPDPNSRMKSWRKPKPDMKSKCYVVNLVTIAKNSNTVI